MRSNKSNRSNKNEETKKSKLGSLKNHSSMKQRRRFEYNMARKNSSPIDLKQKIDDLEVGENLNYSMQRRKSNQSAKNFRMLRDKSHSKGMPELPEVLGQNEMEEVNAPKRIGTYFNFRSAKNSIVKSPVGWDGKAHTPAIQNIPLKADQSIFNQDVSKRHLNKTTEHLAMIKKLQEYKIFLQNLEIKEVKLPSDLEYTHPLDSFIDSINIVMNHKNLEMVKTETLNLATGVRTEFCIHLLEKLRALRYKSTKFDDMYESLKTLTDKYILLETQYHEKKTEMLEYKKETEELCMVKYDLKKKCDSLKADKRDLILQQAEMNERIENLKRKMQEKTSECDSLSLRIAYLTEREKQEQNMFGQYKLPSKDISESQDDDSKDEATIINVLDSKNKRIEQDFEKLK